MSIQFLDIEYVILLSLLQYSTAMVLKSPKYYSSIYMKKQSKTTFYIHNLYKARKNNDYNYIEWEDKKPDIYDYLNPSTNQTSTTASNIFSETSSKEMTNPELPTSPILDSSQYNTSFSSSVTYPTLSSTESTPDTSSSETLSTVATTLSFFSSLSTPHNTTTTTLIQEVSTEITTIVTSTPSTTELLIDNSIQSIRDEIIEAQVKLRAGFFTASVYVLFKIIVRKQGTHVTSLLNGLQAELTRLNSHHHLAMFGPTVNSVFTLIVFQMTKLSVEIIQAEAQTGQKILEDRKSLLQSDTKAIYDVVDTIYIEEDYIRIVDSLTDIQNFPNVSNNEIKVAEKAIEAFIILPYKRIEGSAKEKLLLMEIRDAVGKRMAVDENRISKRDFKKNIKITAKMRASSDINTKSNKITKAHLRMTLTWPTLFPEPTTTNSSEKDYTSYVTDHKIMNRLRHKMKIYKQKIKEIRLKERKMKTKRGPTTTTTSTTTTTEMPPMHKSKYYWRKYVKSNLYKMKTTTKKTTKFLWRYYGKLKTIRRFMTVKNFNIVTKYPLSRDSSDIDSYYSDSDEDDYGTYTHKSNDFTRSMTPTKLEYVSQFNTYKNNITNHILYNNNIINDEESKMKIQDINKIQRSDNHRESVDSNAEAYFQVNLKDAFFHTHNITIDRRFMKKKVNKLTKMDSFSDDEAILKGNIYKAFGYRNDFAKQLRAML